MLLDLTMPGEHGLDALIRIREQAPDTAVIVISGESTIENAVKAGQRGAFDFVPKPIPDPEHLLGVLNEAVRLTRLRRAGTATAEAPRGGSTSAPVGGRDASNADSLGIVGECPAIERLREQIRRVAPSNGRVLITGENGAGKELAALAVHALSKRADGPFVKLNCAAIPKDLLESELFGYEKGAFTGAVATKKGRLELADNGTLFLDEIGDLALEAQAKLLRALETGEIERVGGARIRRSNALIAPTQLPPIGVVFRGRGAPIEHLPAPLIDTERKRQERDLLERPLHQQRHVRRGWWNLIAAQKIYLRQIFRRDVQRDEIADGFVEAVIGAVAIEERLLIVGALVEVVAELVVDGLKMFGVDLDALLHAEVFHVVDVPG